MSARARPRKDSSSLLSTLATAWTASPPTYSYSNKLYTAGEPLDPLLATEDYDEPEKILAFVQALQQADHEYAPDKPNSAEATLRDDAATYAAEGRTEAAAAATYLDLLEQPTPSLGKRQPSSSSTPRTPSEANGTNQGAHADGKNISLARTD